MNPAIAKITPWLLDIMSEDLAENGMIIGEVTVDALTSWTQFFKNAPLLLIVFLLMHSGVFAKEYQSGTLVLILTKGLSRYKVVLAKAAHVLLFWTVGYFLTFTVTYLYNAYFWDNSVAKGLFSAVINYWLFGIFLVSLLLFFSVISKSFYFAPICVGAVALVSYLFGLIPRLSYVLPTALMNSAGLLAGVDFASDYILSCIITSVLSVAAVALSIPVFNKKEI